MLAAIKRSIKKNPASYAVIIFSIACIVAWALQYRQAVSPPPPAGSKAVIELPITGKKPEFSDYRH
jgi:hypothetical protein